ncbi:hypothetical protein HNP84_004391 [Thermocatellispora tengchongensis]|uniref:DUF3017 domain-containing protein n=1 Tax=Thermocatellispora tengchongensis TaxID=1073253 RepID=A0A840PBV1_9ACTN|nr:DUF3017 domain-containing protein [Thermocatellispora tengchongensis]MBB5134657.1 hypothetical protein [Thermocatellispora tengchongensis]
MSERQSAGWGPYLTVLVGAVLGPALVLLGVPPVVGVPVGGAFLLLGAALRLLLPEPRAGLLATRGKTTDAVTLGLLGALLMLGGLILLVPRDWIIG